MFACGNETKHHSCSSNITHPHTFTWAIVSPFLISRVSSKCDIFLSSWLFFCSGIKIRYPFFLSQTLLLPVCSFLCSMQTHRLMHHTFWLIRVHTPPDHDHETWTLKWSRGNNESRHEKLTKLGFNLIVSFATQFRNYSRHAHLMIRQSHRQVVESWFSEEQVHRQDEKCWKVISTSHDTDRHPHSILRRSVKRQYMRWGRRRSSIRRSISRWLTRIPCTSCPHLPSSFEFPLTHVLQSFDCNSEPLSLGCRFLQLRRSNKS